MKKIYTIFATVILVTLISEQVMAQVTFFPNPSMTGSFTISSTSGEAARRATIRIWGAGGNGSNGSTSGGPGGGGGGYYESQANIALAPGTYTYSIASGGSGSLSVTTLTLPNSLGTITVRSGGNATSSAAGSRAAATTAPSSGVFINNSSEPFNEGGAPSGANGGNGGLGVGGTRPSGSTNGIGGGNGSAGGNGIFPGTGGGGGGKSGGAGGIGANGRIEIIWQTGNGAGVLPVTFGAMKASEKGTGVQIDWTSYSEQNLANYQIERSADGINFTSVGEVAPRNVATETQYGFFDALPLSGTSFYRIRNNDIDGKSGLSNIVKINLNKNIKTIGIYPNPVIGNRVSFQTSDLTKGTYNVEVINAFGARVFQQSVNHAGGAINQSLSLPTLQSGSYTLRINGTATASTHKITILQ